MKKKTPHWFKTWRKNLKLTQKEAAHLLGLKSRMLQNYEGGTHEIPLYIRLAMATLNEGIIDYNEGEIRKPKKPLALVAKEALDQKKAADKKKSKAAEKEAAKKPSKSKKASSSKT